MVQKKLAKDLRSRRSLKSIHVRFLKLFQNFHPLFKKDDPLKQVKDQKEKQKEQNPAQHSVDILRSIWETNLFWTSGKFVRKFVAIFWGHHKNESTYPPVEEAQRCGSCFERIFPEVKEDDELPEKPRPFIECWGCGLHLHDIPTCAPRARMRRKTQVKIKGKILLGKKFLSNFLIPGKDEWLCPPCFDLAKTKEKQGGDAGDIETYVYKEHSNHEILCAICGKYNNDLLAPLLLCRVSNEKSKWCHRNCALYVIE